MPPTALVLAAVSSVQVGSAIARNLFDELGAPGVVFLRLVFGSLALVAVWRPRIVGRPRSELGLVAVFGVTLACMNLSFYGSLARLPLGIAVTLEFIGPLGVAVAGSRRPLDLLWVALAAAGIVLLAGGGIGAARPLGVALALLAGGFWAAYILLSARTGRAFPGASGLAAATAIAAVVAAPLGIRSGGEQLVAPHLLAAGAGVGVLSSAIPWSLELEALRRLPTQVFGVLMSLEPAVAALAGFVILHQRLGPRALVAIVLVVAASAGASRAGRAPAPPEP